MSMGDAIRSVLQSNYANFNGRARRSEYWYFYLAVIIAYIVSIIIAAIVHVLGDILIVILALGVIVPTLAVGSRRLHDTGKSGWLQLIGIIPVIGAIALIVFYAQDSEGDNKYGPSPKGGGALAAEPGYPAV